MRVSAMQAMKRLAAENFKLKDVSFVDFEKIDIDEIREVDEKDEDLEAYIEVWANFNISYEGTAPDSYRVLNSMIQDWVDDNDEKIKKLVNPELISFLKSHYKELDISDLNSDFDDYIWEDQVDYMPEIDEDKNDIKFTVELVLEIDEEDSDNE